MIVINRKAGVLDGSGESNPQECPTCESLNAPIQVIPKKDYTKRWWCFFVILPFVLESFTENAVKSMGNSGLCPIRSPVASQPSL